MGGRFGKYGDAKRKAIIRRSRIFGKTIARLKYHPCRLPKDKRIKLQSAGALKVIVKISP